MKLVTKVFYKELLFSIVGVLFGFLLLFAAIDGFSEARFIGLGAYKFKTLTAILALNQPEYIYHLLPICTLIGAVLALSNMASRSELVVWRASGVSLWQMIGMVTSVGAILAVALWLIGDLGIANANRTASDIRKVALNRTTFFKNSGGYWSRQNLDNTHFRFINIENLKDNDTLLNVRLFDFDEHFTLQRFTEAKQAKPQGKLGVWTLMDGRQVDLINADNGLVTNSVETRILFDDVDLKENTLEVVQNYGQDNVNMTIAQIRERMNTMNETGQNSRAFEVAFWQKIFYPLSVIVMILLALPFAFMQTRKGGVGVRVFTGILLGLIFFVMTAVAQYLGPLVTFSPLGLAIAPSLIFFTIAIIWIRRATHV